MKSSRLGAPDVHRLVQQWLAALDGRSEGGEPLPYLASAGLFMRLPARTIRGHDEFSAWYDELTATHFDQFREPRAVSVHMMSPLHAEVSVQFTWQARHWPAPAARSRWTGCALTETWSVVQQDGRPRIRTCTTNAVSLLPGSASPPGLAVFDAA